MEQESYGNILKMRKNSQNSNSDEIKTYLTNSLEDIPFFRARYDERITEEQRKNLILNELNLVKKEVELKSHETQCKSNWYRIANTLSSLAVLLCSSIIIGIQATSECINIPVIVLSSIILIVEGVHKIFRWGPQGVLYKYGTIQLKRISRQIREYMYTFHRYNLDQLLILISQLRDQYDDIDIGLYKTSINGAAKYNTGLDIEEGGGGNFNVPPELNINRHSQVLPSANASTPILSTVPSTPSHVHIHINDSSPNISRNIMNLEGLPSPYMPERQESQISIINKPVTGLNNYLTPTRVSKSFPNTPNTPLRLGRTNSAPPNIYTKVPNIPTLNLSENTDDETPPIFINSSKTN